VCTYKAASSNLTKLSINSKLGHLTKLFRTEKHNSAQIYRQSLLLTNRVGSNFSNCNTSNRSNGNTFKGKYIHIHMHHTVRIHVYNRLND
jgi:hypothetical protein